MRILPLLFPATLALAIAPLPSIAGAPVAFSGQAVSRPAPTAVVPFLVHLPLRNTAELESLVTLQATPGSLVYHQWLTPAQFKAQYGATPATVATAVKALSASGVSVDKVTAQFIYAHATSAVVERAFDADMRVFRGSSGKLHIGSRTSLTLPPALSAIGADVEGVVYHGEARPHYRVGAPVPGGVAATDAGIPFNRYGVNGPLWFDDAKQAYKDPDERVANGTGVHIATVNESDFSGTDLLTYLAAEKIGVGKGDLIPPPTFNHALIPGAPPFNVNDPASGEADLDTQQVAGTAPGAVLTGWSTNAVDFPADFLQVYDTINFYNDEDIVSTSYGECELLLTPKYNSGYNFEGILIALHESFLQGNAQGITYTVSSGDSAGRPCPSAAYFVNAHSGKTFSTYPSVDFPANDPNVTAVGGGNLLTYFDPKNNPNAPKDLNSAYLSENAVADPEPPSDPYGIGNTLINQFWGAGGGQSSIWPKPAWQKGVTPGNSRSVPDIGAFVGGCFTGDPGFVQPCNPDVSHEILVLGGGAYLVIGTSVAAPETAAVIATLEDAAGSRAHPGAGRFGNINPFLYSLPAAVYHKDIAGTNGVISFKSGTYWNPSYGLGSLFQTPLITKVAGIPQTPSNP